MPRQCYLNSVPRWKEPGLFGEIADSKPGGEILQDKPMDTLCQKSKVAIKHE